MSAVKSKGGKAETALRKELWRRGLRYRLHVKKLIGKPDIVFNPKKVVVFAGSRSAVHDAGLHLDAARMAAQPRALGRAGARR